VTFSAIVSEYAFRGDPRARGHAAKASRTRTAIGLFPTRRRSPRSRSPPCGSSRTAMPRASLALRACSGFSHVALIKWLKGRGARLARGDIPGRGGGARASPGCTRSICGRAEIRAGLLRATWSSNATPRRCERAPRLVAAGEPVRRSRANTSSPAWGLFPNTLPPTSSLYTTEPRSAASPGPRNRSRRGRCRCARSPPTAAEVGRPRDLTGFTAAGGRTTRRARTPVARAGGPRRPSPQTRNGGYRRGADLGELGPRAGPRVRTAWNRWSSAPSVRPLVQPTTRGLTRSRVCTRPNDCPTQRTPCAAAFSRWATLGSVWSLSYCRRATRTVAWEPGTSAARSVSAPSRSSSIRGKTRSS